MIRAIAALAGLLLCGGAAAQSGGIVATSGAGSITATSGNIDFIVIEAPTLVDFQGLLTGSSVRIFVIADFTPLIAGVTRLPDPLEAVRLDPAVFEPQPLVAIEGEGMRLPEQRLDAVRRPVLEFDPSKP